MNFNKYLQFLLDTGDFIDSYTPFPVRTFVAVQVAIHRSETSFMRPGSWCKEVPAAYQRFIGEIQRDFFTFPPSLSLLAVLSPPPHPLPLD